MNKRTQDDQVWLMKQKEWLEMEHKKQMEIAGMEATINALWTKHSTLVEELQQMRMGRSSNLQSPPSAFTPQDPKDDGHTPLQYDGNPLQDDMQEDDDGHTPLPTQGPAVLISSASRAEQRQGKYNVILHTTKKGFSQVMCGYKRFLDV